jgi:hypothetical protein
MDTKRRFKVFRTEDVTERNARRRWDYLLYRHFDTRKCLLLREIAPAMRRGGSSFPRCRRSPFWEDAAPGGDWCAVLRSRETQIKKGGWPHFLPFEES